ncbi:hypothetical protein FRX31_021561 [Thalictrum thalictroides]|uniref:Uncharacterized protein n=1 Tax=Thalictrum thalictroides TaxID=46969 RepID=A0A7J6VX10_THATH|nr:hypothetical protein FRX31_021561 [Thalictrum thalictroides]
MQSTVSNISNKNSIGNQISSQAAIKPMDLDLDSTVEGDTGLNGGKPSNNMALLVEETKGNQEKQNLAGKTFVEDDNRA